MPPHPEIRGIRKWYLLVSGFRVSRLQVQSLPPSLSSALMSHLVQWILQGWMCLMRCDNSRVRSWGTYLLQGFSSSHHKDPACLPPLKTFQSGKLLRYKVPAHMLELCNHWLHSILLHPPTGRRLVPVLFSVPTSDIHPGDHSVPVDTQLPPCGF